MRYHERNYINSKGVMALWPHKFFIFLYMLFYIIKLFRSITSKKVVLVYSLV